VIGIIPVVGDIVNLYLSLQLVKLAQTIDDGGLPSLVVSKMMTNIMIDFALGLTPVLGIVAGALYKANSRNSLILSHFLTKRAKENVKKGLFLQGDEARAQRSWFGWGNYWKKQSQNKPSNIGDDDEEALLETQQQPQNNSLNNNGSSKPQKSSSPPLPQQDSAPQKKGTTVTTGQVSGSYPVG
jgi:hypothetical protein